MKLPEFRQQYPQYDHVDDAQLAQRLHSTYYADMPFEAFSQQIDYTPAVGNAGQQLATAMVPAVTDVAPQNDNVPQPGGIGRIETALSQYSRGFGNVLSSIPKSTGILESQGGPDVLALMDRMDTGEIVRDLPVDIYQMHDLFNYQRQPDMRAELRTKYQSLSQGPEKTKAYQLGKVIDDFFVKNTRVSPQYGDEFFSGQLPQGLGSTLGFAAMAAVTRGRGGAVQFGTTAATGAAVQAASSFEDAVNHGASLEDAYKASKYGAMIGTTEALPIMSILNRIDKGSGGTVKRIITDTIKSGTEEAVQEGIQGILDNLNASTFVKYDPERDTWAGTGDGAGVGFTTGALIQLLGSLAGLKMKPNKGRELGRAMQEAVDNKQLTSEDMKMLASNPVADLGQIMARASGTQANIQQPTPQGPPVQQGVMPLGGEQNAPPLNVDPETGEILNPSVPTTKVVPKPEMSVDAAFQTYRQLNPQDRQLADLAQTFDGRLDPARLESIIERTATETEGLSDEHFQTQLTENIRHAIDPTAGTADRTRPAPVEYRSTGTPQQTPAQTHAVATQLAPTNELGKAMVAAISPQVQPQPAPKVKEPAAQLGDVSRQASTARVQNTQPTGSRDGNAAVSVGRQGTQVPAPTAKDKAVIADFGEKIGGARKDTYQRLQASLSDTLPDDIGEITLAKYFPEPDYKLLKEAGLSVEQVAFIDAARSEIPPKPRKAYKRQKWVKNLAVYRDLVNAIIADPKADHYANKVIDILMKGRDIGQDTVNTKSLEPLVEKAKLSIEMGFPETPSAKHYQIEKVHFSKYDGEENVDKWELKNTKLSGGFGGLQNTAHFDTRDEAINALKIAMAVEKSKPISKQVNFDIWTERRSDKGFIIGKKIATRKFVELKSGFNSAQEARDYIAKHQENLERELTRKKEIPAHRREVNNTRIGKDHRNGVDVTPEQFGETFGFRGVEFGNWVEQEKRQNDLNDAYDGLLDLAGILSISPKAISLNGELGLAFGARGKGKRGPITPTAHYEPGKVVINLTKKQGAGSLAHEWWHALDNYFSRARGDKAGYVTSSPKKREHIEGKWQYNQNIRLEVVEAFDNVVNAIVKTDLIKRSKQLDKKLTKDHWSTRIELTARAFESYVINKLAERGAESDYLANVISEDVYNVISDIAGESDIDTYPYIKSNEMEGVVKAYDHLFETLKTKETKKGTALFSKLGPRVDQEAFADVAKLYNNIRHHDQMSQYKISESESLPTIARDIYDGVVVKLWDNPMAGQRDLDGVVMTRSWVMSVPTGLRSDGEDKMSQVFITERKDGTVYINISNFKQGTGGSLVYHIVANYAYNNNKVFVADPDGLSAVSLRRRTSNMLSSALKFGTTRHLRPHTSQVEGLEEVPPLAWIPGDDAHNITSLLKTEYQTVMNVVPEMANIVYDIKQGNFIDENDHDKHVTEIAFRKLAQSPGARKARAGRATLKRTALAHALVREASGDGRRRILAAVIRESSQHLPAGLKRILYSRPTSPAIAGLSVSDIEKIIAPVMLKWGTNAPRVEVVADLASVPEHVVDADAHADSRVEAVFDPNDRTVYLVADGLSRDRVLRVLAHEAVGHHSMAEMLGDDFITLMDRVQWLKKSGNQTIGDVAKEVRQRYGKLDLVQESQEIIAVMAEKKVKHPVFKRVMTAIKKFLRRLGIALEFSVSDLQGMIAKAGKRLQRDVKGEAQSDRRSPSKAMFSRPDNEVAKDIEQLASDAPTFKEWVGKAKSAALDDTRPAWLGTLTRLHLEDVGKDVLPQITPYVKLAQKMDADRNNLVSEAAEVAQEWTKFMSQDAKAADTLAGLMHEATIAGVDPAEPYKAVVDFKEAKKKISLLRLHMRQRSGEGTGKWQIQVDELIALMQFETARAPKYAALRHQYLALPAAATNIYHSVRDMYQARFDAIQKALEARIDRAELSQAEKTKFKHELRLKFESAQVQAPYFPLARFGDYWVSVKKPGNWQSTYEIVNVGKNWGVTYANQRRILSQFNTRAEALDWVTDKTMKTEFEMFRRSFEARKHAKLMKAKGYGVTQGAKLENIQAVHGASASASFVADVIAIVNPSGSRIGDQVADSIYQLFLSTLPDMSVRKHFVHRSKTKGYSQDALRAFANQTFHGSYQLAKLRYADKLEALLENMKDSLAASADPYKASHILNELQKRHEWAMNPTSAQWANMATSVGFVWYLGVSPSAALVNVTQTALVALPVMGSRYGFTRSAAELTKASTDYFSGGFDIEKSLDGDELRAYRQLVEEGVIDKTLAHDLASLSESERSIYSTKKAKVMAGISFLFHHAEKFNREVTSMAVYRLARKKGLGHNTAVDEARHLTYESHFDYSSANKPRFMQNDWAKIFLIFKQYTVNMWYLLGRNLQQSFKGESRVVRREAQKKLAGILGMHVVAAGTMGFPMFWVVEAVLNAVFDDPDEPWDFKTEYRNFLADYFGKEAAEAIANGVGNAAGIDLHSRVSLNELWFRSPDRELESRATVGYWLEQSAGPLAGIAVNAGRGLDLMHEGHVVRGIEAATPKAIRDGIRALRYADEGGVISLRGDEVVGDLAAWELGMKAIGFSPARVNRQYDANRSLRNYEQQIHKRRQLLINRWYLAWRTRDREGMRDGIKEIRRFNSKNRRNAISMDTLRQSWKTRRRFSHESRAGVHLNKRDAHLRGRVRFGDE